MTKKNKKSYLLFFLILMLMLGVAPLIKQAEDKNMDQQQKLTGRDIMVSVYNRPDGEDRMNIWQMTLIDKKGRKRMRKAIFYSKDYGEDTKSLIYFQEPGDIRGTGFLSYEYESPQKDDDRWLYLPALKKVRRISGTSNNDYFMGTDFIYDDMGKRRVDDDVHTLLKLEDLGGQQCWVIESVPKDKSYLYSKKISWILKDSLGEARIEYYDRRGPLMKVLTVPVQRKQDGFWTAFKMEMDNIQEKHKTIIETIEVRYNQGIKDSFFRVSSLEQGRIYK